MAKLGRAIVPDVPHHVTQRGNRRQSVFFGDDDYRLYVELLGEHCRTPGVTVWAWFLMPNHAHLIFVPPSAEAMTTAIADTHRRYSFVINRRQGWRGNIWQGRLGSCAMDEPQALSATALRRTQSGPGATGAQAGGLALVQRPRAFRHRPRHPRPAARP